MTNSEKKAKVAEQLKQILEQIEAAKEHWLDDDEKGCLLLLQAASRPKETRCGDVCGANEANGATGSR